MDTVLVTGGAGYIGSHAVHALRERGWNVVVVDDLSTGRKSLVPQGVALHVGDVGDVGFIKALVQRERPRAVLHFAGAASVPESVANPLKYYRRNFSASVALTAACVAADVQALIFSSSSAVYGAPAKLPINEDTPPLPINPYGHSKRMTEIMLADVARATPLRYAALRYFNVAGADAAGRSGPVGHNSTNLIKTIAELAAGKRESLTVFGEDYPTPDGSCVRDFIHVTDLVEAHVLALDYLLGGGVSTTLNCGYGHGFSVLEVLAAAKAIAGPLKILKGPRRPGDPPTLIAETARIHELLKWKPTRDDLPEMLRSAIAWEKSLAP